MLARRCDIGLLPVIGSFAHNRHLSNTNSKAHTQIASKIEILRTLGARGLHAPHPDGRPKAGKTSGLHEAKAGKTSGLRSLRAVGSFYQPSAGRLDGQRVDLWHPGRVDLAPILLGINKGASSLKYKISKQCLS